MSFLQTERTTAETQWFIRIYDDFKHSYENPMVLRWCCWHVIGMTGYFQVCIAIIIVIWVIIAAQERFLAIYVFCMFFFFFCWFFADNFVHRHFVHVRCGWIERPTHATQWIGGLVSYRMRLVDYFYIFFRQTNKFETYVLRIKSRFRKRREF